MQHLFHNKSGCLGRVRTYDQVINSHLLYHWATKQFIKMLQIFFALIEWILPVYRSRKRTSLIKVKWSIKTKISTALAHTKKNKKHLQQIWLSPWDSNSLIGCANQHFTQIC